MKFQNNSKEAAPCGAKKNMEIIILVSLDALFLVLLILIAVLDRKVERAEKTRYTRSLEHADRKLREYAGELDELREQIEDLSF